MAGNGVSWSHQATFEGSAICASRARDFVTRHLVEHRLLYLVAQAVWASLALRRPRLRRPGPVELQTMQRDDADKGRI
jgi:hypothetical protein